MRSFISLLGALVLLPLSATAAQLDMLTGPRTGTYYTFGKEIAALSKKDDLTLNVVSSEGSVDNIKRVNKTATPSVAIVQSDVLGFLSRSNNPTLPKMLAKLRVIYPLYMEEIHVLALKEIHDFKELQGLRVAVGEEGSGHMLTAINLFAIEKIEPADMRKISPEEGVVEVLRGNLDAVVLVGGKPLRIFKNMEELSDPENRKFRLLLDNVHFLPMNDAKFYEEYEPTEITHSDYGFVQNAVPTIAVPSVLMSLDSGGASAGRERCESLKKLSQLLRENINNLKANGHPKWREINLDKEVLGWKKDECVWGLNSAD